MTTHNHHVVAAAPAQGKGSGNGEGRQYLIFTLNGEAFAIDILRIREIIDYDQPTEVPMMPEAIRGVINLRGAVVPVIDLSARFGRGRTQVARRACIVILEVDAADEEGGTQILGIVVDGVDEVLEISAADVEPAPAFGSHLRTDFIAGLGRVHGRFIVILDLRHLLSLRELAGLAETVTT